MSEKSRYLRTPEAAAYVGLTASSLQKLRLTGDGPRYAKLGRKIVVYPVLELDAWIAKRMRTSTSDTGAEAA
jgi:predicted DNA-binding transcriptional regulator AlpA